jgi:D-lyxose ketol-isomerase
MTTPSAEHYRREIAHLLHRAGIVLPEAELASIEIADMGLGRFETEGIGVVVYINNDRYCAKELVMLPGQTCPEHRHPPVGADPGKQETFRVRTGLVYLHVEGEPTPAPLATPPADRAAFYTAAREIVLGPGEQFTIPPDTLHWFQAGPEGAVVSEFSSTSRDGLDIFTDPAVRRV